MNSQPWMDWVPGALSKEQIEELCKADLVRCKNNVFNSIDESSIDLTLSSDAYRLTGGAVKPSSERPYLKTLLDFDLVEKLELTKGHFILKKSESYLIKLNEELSIYLQGTEIYGQATAKSSVGRVDVLVRIIVDNMSGYDVYDPKVKSEGEIYAEISPISFDVRVKPNISLAQLRLFYGDPKNSEIQGKEICETCILNSKIDDGLLSVNLDADKIQNLEGVAFEGGAMPDQQPLDLWKLDESNKPKPWEYFKLLQAPENRLFLKPSSFYILRSKERLSIPDSVAVYIRAIDETLGEMRIHYAGFAHPWFGRNRDDGKGTPIIFEVRGHDVPALLFDQEKMARLTFYRMSKPAKKPEKSEYDAQELKLSSFFADFPERLVRHEDGSILPEGET